MKKTTKDLAIQHAKNSLIFSVACKASSLSGLTIKITRKNNISKWTFCDNWEDGVIADKGRRIKIGQGGPLSDPSPLIGMIFYPLLTYFFNFCSLFIVRVQGETPPSPGQLSQGNSPSPHFYVCDNDWLNDWSLVGWADWLPDIIQSAENLISSSLLISKYLLYADDYPWIGGWWAICN